MFILINNFDEYKLFIQELENKFDNIEEWQDFFGFDLRWNEETGEVLETLKDYKGDIGYKPTDFPAILYSTFDNIVDYRNGNMKVRLLDFISINELKTK